MFRFDLFQDFKERSSVNVAKFTYLIPLIEFSECLNDMHRPVIFATAMCLESYSSWNSPGIEVLTFRGH